MKNITIRNSAMAARVARQLETEALIEGDADSMVAWLAVVDPSFDRSSPTGGVASYLDRYVPSLVAGLACVVGLAGLLLRGMAVL